MSVPTTLLASDHSTVCSTARWARACNRPAACPFHAQFVTALTPSITHDQPSVHSTASQTASSGNDLNAQGSATAKPSNGSYPRKQVLYRGPYMLPFRLLVRAKVFQLVGIAAAAIPITTIFTEASPCCHLFPDVHGDSSCLAQQRGCFQSQEVPCAC